MKILLISTMAFGALCISEMNQSANAALPESTSADTLLVRGGHDHGGERGADHGFENRDTAGEKRDSGGRGEVQSKGATADHNVRNDHPTADENRLHTLNNDLRKDEGLGYGEGWTGIDGGVNCSNDPNSGLPLCNAQ